jgi:serine/threonine protein phosphatase 1
MMLQTFNINEKGRDFVIGDLHGQLHLLEYFLANNNYDSTADRIFSVGDLIDRGEDSLGCFELLDWPGFHAVRGNHEQLMFDYLTGGPTGAWWMHNGGKWFLDRPFSDLELKSMIQSLSALPWLITVNMQNGKKFHIVHAEVHKIKTLPATDEVFANEEKLHLLASSTMGDGEAFLWGRDLWGPLYNATLDERTILKTKRRVELQGHPFNDNLSHIFSGHTTVRKITTIIGQTNLDTGAFRTKRDSWAGLSVAEPLTGKFWTINEKEVREVQPIVV